ncbi:MAG: FAD-binding oxidoreductase [Verrucomicrobia bacterium]|nr:FAD-binding oxidoreductase [Verrucomicrobiota bacterium]
MIDQHCSHCARTLRTFRHRCRAACAHDLHLSVRGGGHDWAGRALCQNGLVNDLSGMRKVTVDADARVARIGDGATAADVGAELVLVDGRLVTADANQNSDLFWALRGGGRNFGVVTSMRLRLHRELAWIDFQTAFYFIADRG